MKGAIIFLIVFFAMIAATLAYTELPPGKQIYDAASLPATVDYTLGGIPVPTFIAAIFNGVFYGVIAWIAFTIIEKSRKTP
ncbi:MAG: hypothetical protein QW840_04340 [Candidatus Bathyarchaeia archaeon]